MRQKTLRKNDTRQRNFFTAISSGGVVNGKAPAARCDMTAGETWNYTRSTAGTGTCGLQKEFLLFQLNTGKQRAGRKQSRGGGFSSEGSCSCLYSCCWSVRAAV